MISVEKVTKVYGETAVLSDISMELYEGNMDHPGNPGLQEVYLNYFPAGI